MAGANGGFESVSRGTGPWISISFTGFGASNCLGSFLQAWFLKKHLYIFTVDFPEFFQFWIHTFLETIATTLMNGPSIIHWLPLITHDAAQLGFTNLFSWHIWGWNHDAATDYAGVQLVTRQLCLENYLYIANALCVDKALLLSQFDASTTLIDWLVLGATHCETILSNSCLQINWT